MLNLGVYSKGVCSKCECGSIGICENKCTDFYGLKIKFIPKRARICFIERFEKKFDKPYNSFDLL